MGIVSNALMIRKRRRQSAAELEEEALSPSNDAVMLTESEILQLRLLEADRRAQGAETLFCTQQ